jgi:hypothetical protein
VRSASAISGRYRLEKRERRRIPAFERETGITQNPLTFVGLW